MIPALLSVIIAFSIVAVSVVEITINNFFIVGNTIESQQAFNVAEAGINYYLWHLNHNNTDFKDGKTTPNTPDALLGYGPYTHNYIDSDGVNEGTYTLYVNPAGGGSTVVTVRSIGIAAGSNIKRTVEAKIGSQSFASYGVVSDISLWFGNNETANGPVHSNQGIRMDGPNNSTASSASTTYTPAGTYGGDGSSHPGVWCKSTVTTPVDCNTRSKSDWIYPVAAVDFNQVSSSLCTIKKVAFAAYSATSALAGQANACTQVPATRTNTYIPQRSTTYSTTKGYLIQLNSNGTYDLYNVNAETDTAATYSSALTTTVVATGLTIPSAGVIFVEDNVWVRTNPDYHGRVSIAAGKLASSSPANYANIVIADQLKYSTKNGSDAIGLIAQDSILMAPYAPPASGAFTFEVDAALIAQTGQAWYPSTYRSSTNRCTRGWVNSNQVLNFYGAVATRQTWTWTWLQGASACGDAVYDASQGYISGIEHNSTQYDYNLQYSPPPSFPLTAGYNILSWREILTHP